MTITPRLLDAAARIGDRLVTDAIWHEDACTWIGAVMEPVGDVWELVHRSCGGDLYEGTAGIAVFLARLARVTGQGPHREAALGAARHALDWLDRTDDLSLYGGATGVAWAAATVAALTGEDRLAAAASAVAHRAAAAVAAGGLPAVDYMSGRAGVVAGLVALAAGDDLLRERAAVIAEGIVAAGTDDGACLSWPAGGEEPGLCGLGHGAAGIAAAMRELSTVTGEDRWTAVADAAERYERGWLHPEQPGWPDLRGLDRAALASGAAPSYPAFWCHGAGGIGLQRLRAHELSGGDVALADAGAALQAAADAAAVVLAPPATAGAPPPDLSTNPSLCHGVATLADLLGYAARLFDQAPHRDLAGRLGAHLAGIVEGTVAAWPSGVVGGGETPGLLLGWSGVGAVLLRLAGAGPSGPVGLVTPPG